MNLQQGFVLTKRQLEFLKLGASTDNYRGIIKNARFEWVNGKAYIMTTNTHVAHVINVSAPTGLADFTFDVSRVLYEMRFDRSAVTATFNYDHDVMVVEFTDKNGEFVDRIQRDVVTKPGDGRHVYPDWTRVVPDVKDLTGGKFGHFNFQYLMKASYLASESANRVCLMGGEPSRPFIVAPRECNPWDAEWFAVIMPMAKS